MLPSAFWSPPRLRKRGEADALALRGLGDEDESLLRGRPGSAASASSAARPAASGLERTQGNVEQDTSGLIADALVGIAAERLGQHGHGAELADRCPPHTRIAVVACD